MKWEYKVIYVRADGWTKTGLPNELNEELDALGNEGWELVATEALNSFFWYGSYTRGLVAFFKRPLHTPRQS